MNKKVIILIDGQNLYYSLKSLNIKESDINWGLFINSLLIDNDELIRTYWFRPQKIHDSYFTQDNIAKHFLYKNYSEHLDNYFNNNSIVPNDILKKTNEYVKKALEWLSGQKERFKRIEYIYDQI